MPKRRMLAVLVAAALALGASPHHSTYSPQHIQTISTVVKRKPPVPHRYPALAKKFPGHSERWYALAKKFPGHSDLWYRKVGLYLTALEKAQEAEFLRAWIAAISFPPAYLRPVIACIKNAESGNYSESSHPSSGSGAYQYVPGTWLHWFLAWRDSLPESSPYKHAYYVLAYLAPPEAQDHVLVYTLEHGGAHNWDPAFGNDSCTVGLP